MPEISTDSSRKGKSRVKTRQCDITALLVARKEAASYGATLTADQRKKLGQFFTGLPLARLLAVLSTRKTCRTVIDPMAGTGDLLDAVIERSDRNEIPLTQVDAIEIDVTTAERCEKRLSPWLGIMPSIQQQVHIGSAFDPDILSKQPANGYDLVITNPPYVRYQTVSQNGSINNGQSRYDIRSALLDMVEGRVPVQEQAIWRELIRGFSGLSDLSVPSWLLAAMLVKPSGVLALVAPATWRTRNYADVLLYMLARFFSLDAVVADRQPGWFSEALVRTHLVIATRLSSDKACSPLQDRKDGENSCAWVEIDPEARAGDSLVGAAFPSDDPELEFAHWLFGQRHVSDNPRGVLVNERRNGDEIASVLARCHRAPWFRKVEPTAAEGPLFGNLKRSTKNIIPHLLGDVLGSCLTGLVYLTQLGISISQGLRTGCNDFFYVDLVEQIDDQFAKVRASNLLGGACLTVPIRVLGQVLRRQSEVQAFINGESLPGRVLDLRHYVLPEDYPDVVQAKSSYEYLGLQPPVIMPDDLANHVRRAAITRRGKKGDGALIPCLSAVKTNVRPAKSGPRPQIPRFWYMLPDFARRHRPDVFVPRINQHTPLAVANRVPPILIDANFSTVWAENSRWRARSIEALLNSSWARACMEAIGTPMGGGALKLEATHLRRLPMPRLNDQDIEQVEILHKTNPPAARDKIDQIIVSALLKEAATESSICDIIRCLREFIRTAEQARQRG